MGAFMGGFYRDGGRWKTPKRAFERSKFSRVGKTPAVQFGIFPGVATDMISVGEQTGALPQMLNSVAEFFEEDVQTSLAAIMSLIEPAILIFMGVVVVAILIALYLPIFSLGNVTGGPAGT